MRLMQSLNSHLPRAQSAVKRGREGNCGHAWEAPSTVNMNACAHSKCRRYRLVSSER